MIRRATDYQKALTEISRLEADLDPRNRSARGGSVQVKQRIEKERLLARLRDEAETYRSMERGELKLLNDLSKIGDWLITLRLSRGLSELELGKLTGVSLKQVSNDERKGYSSISAQRAHRLLEALGVEYQLCHVLSEPTSETPLAEAAAVPTEHLESDSVRASLDTPAQVAELLRADESLSMEQALHLSYAFNRLYATYVAVGPNTDSASESVR